MAASCFPHSPRSHAVLQVMHVLKTRIGRPLSGDVVIRTASLRSLRQRLSMCVSFGYKHLAPDIYSLSSRCAHLSFPELVQSTVQTRAQSADSKAQSDPVHLNKQSRVEQFVNR